MFAVTEELIFLTVVVFSVTVGLAVTFILFGVGRCEDTVELCVGLLVDLFGGFDE